MKKKLLMSLICCAALTGLESNAQGQQKAAVFNHMALSVVDLEKSTEFYRDVIGLEQIPEPFKVGLHSWFKVSEHGQLHIIAKSEGIREHDRNTHLCFSIPSMEEFIGHLEEMDVEYANLSGEKKPQTRPDGVQQIYLQDPDGYWIEINDDYPRE